MTLPGRGKRRGKLGDIAQSLAVARGGCAVRRLGDTRAHGRPRRVVGLLHGRSGMGPDDYCSTTGPVPFRMTNVAPRGVPALPWVSAFPELNVRTYVRVGGRPGVYFFSLDAGNPVAVGVARVMAHLPPWIPHIVSVPLARRVVSTTGRHQFYTVRVRDGKAEPAFKASGDITSMAAADGYIEIPAQTDVVEAGEIVDTIAALIAFTLPPVYRGSA